MVWDNGGTPARVYRVHVVALNQVGRQVLQAYDGSIVMV